MLTSDALYDGEPVAGLSDAFLVGDSELHVYHTVNVEPRLINTKTVVVFRAKTTCIQQQSCEECLNLRQVIFFNSPSLKGMVFFFLHLKPITILLRNINVFVVGLFC